MINKFDFNYIISLNENNFFLKQKKNSKFIKKLSMNFKYKRLYVFIYFKMQEYLSILLRFESLFGQLPRISSLKTRKKGKTKKIIFLRSTLTIKSFSVNYKIIENVLSYIFNLHNYLYLRFLITKKHKVVRLEELTKHFIKKKFVIQHQSILLENNLYFKWLDLNRSFINIENFVRYVFKRKALFSDFKRLKFYNCKLIINSSHYKFFALYFKILLKNYRKLIVYLFKKLRKRRKNEKAYILL